MRVLIAGCGDVGNRLANMLAANGHEVWGLRRKVFHLPEEVNPVRADLEKPETLKNLPRHLDMVFFTAAAQGRSEDHYRACYVQGLANLLGALKQLGENPKRIFFTSSTGVYGQNNGEWVDENTLTAPDSYTGGVILEAERILNESHYPTTIVRFGGIYGPGRTRLLNMAASNEPVNASAIRYTNRIHSDDCAAVLLHLMGVPDPQSLYVAVDDEPSPHHEVMFWLKSRMGKSVPGKEKAEDGAQAVGKRCSNERLKKSGFVFRYSSYREGYAELLKSWQG